MIWRRIAQWLADGHPCCLVTIAETRGSTPREAGARMALGRDGRFTGTIGGGALEWEAMALAQALMGAHPAGHGETRVFSLGPSLAQCCGGALTLRFEVLASDDCGWVAPLARLEGGGTFATRARPDSRGVWVREARDTGEGLPERHGTARQPLFLFGAGHVARALVLALAPLPFAIRWIESRPAAFPEVMPGNATPVHHPEPARLIADAPAGSLVLVMTHSHALDFEIIARALQRDELAFVGLIGSETKRAKFLSRLADMGLGRAAGSRLICPVGLRDIVGKAPSILAVSIAAQLLALRAFSDQVEAG